MACEPLGLFFRLQGARDFAVDMDDFKRHAKDVAVEFDPEWNFGD